jgi:flavin-dependent dehydrogenase
LFDLVVVGSGPAGSRLAARVAEAGLRTLLVEEHEQVGLPVHCTGIVGEEMLRRYTVPDPVRAACLDRFDVISPAGRRARLPGVHWS